MEYFLEASHLDAATADMLKKYDRDGNGSFSKDEVVAIILDLREAMQSNEMLGASNKMFKRMLIVAVTFCILLLTSIFGLSYAVAALTAKTDVNSDGIMTTIDGSKVIKTDSTAYTFKPAKIDSGSYCVSPQEASDLMSRVMSGSNVLMKLQAVNNTRTVVQRLSSSTMDMGGDSTICFTSSNQELICMSPSEECTAARRNRRLVVVEGVNASNFMTECENKRVNDPESYKNFYSLSWTCMDDRDCFEGGSIPNDAPNETDDCVCACMFDIPELVVTVGSRP